MHRCLAIICTTSLVVVGVVVGSQTSPHAAQLWAALDSDADAACPIIWALQSYDCSHACKFTCMQVHPFVPFVPIQRMGCMQHSSSSVGLWPSSSPTFVHSCVHTQSRVARLSPPWMSSPFRETQQIATRSKLRLSFSPSTRLLHSAIMPL